VDLTHWFCWVTVAGAMIGLLAAVQQLLIHGLKSFVRAVFVTCVIGLALALGYPHVQVRPVGGGTQIALAVNATPVESAPAHAAPLERTPRSSTPASPASAPVARAGAESAAILPTTADDTSIGPSIANDRRAANDAADSSRFGWYPRDAALDDSAGINRLAESVPVGPPPAPPALLDPASLGLTTSPGATPLERGLAESTSAEPTAITPTAVHSTFKLAERATVEPKPVDPTALNPAAINRTPFEPGAVPKERSKAVAVKPTLPALLPAQQKLFSPSQVVYCPICSSAYSSSGPKVGVTCPHCGGKVNLGSSRDYMVHRCGTCGKLCRTTHFPPAIGPYFFRYFCPYCREYHWFRD
jgi:hypothetical protein